jgi:thiosulfate sulfurtransferase
MLDETAPQIVDIRDEQSFQQGRIRGAQHLDNSSLQTFIETADLDAPLVVCCYHGNSSQQAAAYLNSKGFEHTFSLDGGFSAWSASYPDLTEAG